MSRILLALIAGVTMALSAGCVVAPARHAQASVYMAPDYDSPGPGYGWELHAKYGWGWRHPHRGWHRGWR